MRRLHRWVSLVSVLFLAIIAATGIFLHLEESGERKDVPERQVQAASPSTSVPARAQRPNIALPSAELVQWMNTTMEAARKASSDSTITSVQLRIAGEQPQGVVTLATPEAKQLVFNARTGELLESWSSHLPATNRASTQRQEASPQRPQERQEGQLGLGQPGQGQPSQAQGMNLHRVIIGLHKGDLLGETGEWIGVICGLALFLLCLSGVIMYFELWRRRLRNGKRALFWS
jgi:hypothetical protein